MIVKLRDRYDVGLAVLIIVALAEMTFRIAINRQSLGSDMGFHFIDSVRLLLAPWDSTLLEPRPFYAPFVSFVAVPFNLIFGFSPKLTTVGTEGTFLALLLFCTYGVGRHLFGAAVGFLAAVLLISYPVIYGQAAEFMDDIPMAAMLVLAVWLLLLTEDFQRTDYAAALGFALGLGAMTKQPFPIFVILPLAAMSAKALWIDIRNRHRGGAMLWKGRIARMALAGSICLAISLPWYGPRMAWFVGGLSTIATAAVANQFTPSTGSLGAFIYFSAELWVDTSVLLELAFIVCGGVFFVRGKTGRLLLASWLIGAVAVGGLIPAREMRYFMPGLPAVALATAAGFVMLLEQFSRARLALKAVLGVVLAFNAFELYAMAYGVRWLPEGREISATPRLWYDPMILFSQGNEYVVRVTKPTFNVGGIARYLYLDSMNHHVGETTTVAIFTPPEVRSAFWVLFELRDRKSYYIVGPEIRPVDDPERQHVIPDYIIRERFEPTLAPNLAKYWHRHLPTIEDRHFMTGIGKNVQYEAIYTADVGLNPKGQLLTIYRRISDSSICALH